MMTKTRYNDRVFVIEREYCMTNEREGEVIASRQNRRVVNLCKLSDRKTREAESLFRFDGVKLLCEAIKRGVEIDAVYLKSTAAARVFERMNTLYGCTREDVTAPVFLIEDTLFEKISEENAPEGVITVAKYIDRFHKMYIIKKEGEKDTPPEIPDGPILLLESVRDPGNVGTIIRTAAALGIRHMIVSRDCADLYHPRTIRAAMGALFAMPITRVDDLSAMITHLRAHGRRIFAAALDEHAARLGEHAFASGDGVVIGNEGHGLSSDVIRACDQSLYIPMQADTESLNAGIAAALVMWELSRAGSSDQHISK